MKKDTANIGEYDRIIRVSFGLMLLLLFWFEMMGDIVSLETMWGEIIYEPPSAEDFEIYPFAIEPTANTKIEAENLFAILMRGLIKELN